MSSTVASMGSRAAGAGAGAAATASGGAGGGAGAAALSGPARCAAKLLEPVLLSDSPKQVRKKIRRAYSGGRETVEEHRR